MSNAQILAHIKSASGSSCGRFTAQQLQQEYIAPAAVPVAIRKRFIAWLISLFVGNATAIKAQSDSLKAAPDSIAFTAPDSLGFAAPDSMAVNDTVQDDSAVYVWTDTIPHISEDILRQPRELYDLNPHMEIYTSGVWISEPQGFELEIGYLMDKVMICFKTIADSVRKPTAANLADSDILKSPRIIADNEEKAKESTSTGKKDPAEEKPLPQVSQAVLPEPIRRKIQKG
jgi:hypothetical protein